MDVNYMRESMHHCGRFFVAGAHADGTTAGAAGAIAGHKISLVALRGHISDRFLPPLGVAFSRGAGAGGGEYYLGAMGHDLWHLVAQAPTGSNLLSLLKGMANRSPTDTVATKNADAIISAAARGRAPGYYFVTAAGVIANAAQLPDNHSVLDELRRRKDDTDDVVIRELGVPHPARSRDSFSRGLFAASSLPADYPVAVYGRHCGVVDTLDKVYHPLRDYDMVVQLRKDSLVVTGNPLVCPAAMVNDCHGMSGVVTNTDMVVYLHVGRRCASIMLVLMTDVPVEQGSELYMSYGKASYWASRKRSSNDRRIMQQQLMTTMASRRVPVSAASAFASAPSSHPAHARVPTSYACPLCRTLMPPLSAVHHRPILLRIRYGPCAFRDTASHLNALMIYLYI